MRQQRTKIPEWRSIVLRGREAEAFLKDAAKPPTRKQTAIVKRALEEFKGSGTEH